MSTLSPEKDSLLGLMVQEKIAHQILKNEVFLDKQLFSLVIKEKVVQNVKRVSER